jgi:AraC-like DNA-binding protein
MNATAPSASRNFAEILSETEIFRDYESAFQTVSGLPLVLRPLNESAPQRPLPTGGNAFCQLMAQDHAACGECLNLQQVAARGVGGGACTLECFAGLSETAVPVRVQDETVALLRTGHVMLHPPQREAFSKVARLLLKWGATVNLKEAEQAWLMTRVLEPDQYRSLVRLLEIFGRHLGMIGEQLPRAQAIAGGPSEIERAKSYIRENSTRDLAVADVARVVNWSTHYFSRKFTVATGLRFTEFVTRVRVEQARHLLGNPEMRINEIAFKVGFQSLSQFNRQFHRLLKQSPSDYRKFNGVSQDPK